MAALIYTRVSTVEQGTEGLSLAAQLAECQRYVASQGWVIDVELQDILSGQKDARPGYQALLARVRELRSQGRSCAVVVSALDRFGRRILERVRSREELKALGVETHSVREGGVVSDLVANVLASVAQEEVRRTGERVHNTWEYVKSQGWFKCCTAMPWGYVSREATEDERKAGSPRTVLDVDPVAGPYAAELFVRFAKGESAGSLARWASSLPAEIRGEWKLGRQRRSTKREFSRRGLTATLRNDVYVAEAPARWPALVSADTWNRVQARLDANKAAPRADSAKYPLSGLARCQCGHVLRGATLGAQGYRRYRCGSQARALGKCYASYDAGKVEAAIFDQVSERFATFLATDDATNEATWRKITAPEPVEAGQTKRLEDRIAVARRRIAGATVKFVDGELDKPAYDAMVQDEQDALTSAEKELGRLQAKGSTNRTLPSLNAVRGLLGGFRGALSEADPMAAREILVLLLAGANVSRLSPGKYAIDLQWTSLGAAIG